MQLVTALTKSVMPRYQDFRDVCPASIPHYVKLCPTPNPSPNKVPSRGSKVARVALSATGGDLACGNGCLAGEAVGLEGPEGL